MAGRGSITQGANPKFLRGTPQTLSYKPTKFQLICSAGPFLAKSSNSSGHPIRLSKTGIDSVSGFDNLNPGILVGKSKRKKSNKFAQLSLEVYLLNSWNRYIECKLPIFNFTIEKRLTGGSQQKER